MGKNANFVSHKKSKLIVDGKPKLPSAGSLVEGEIAINFAENVETLSIKNESGTVVTFSSDNYYSEQKLGSGFTGENSAVTVTDAIEELREEIGVDVDQVLDETTSASTNPIATHAVYEVIAADELVWANAYVTLSGSVAGKFDASAFTAYSGAVDTAIGNKLDTADFKTYSGTVDTQIGNKLDTSAFTAYSGAVDTTIGNKLNTADFNTYSGAVDSELSTKLDSSDIANFFDVVKYEDSGTSKVINFYNGNTLKATINADDFIVDGMISGVTLESKSGTTYLVINWNTAAGDQTTELNIGDIFEADNYYDKNSIDSIVGTGFTVSSITEVIESNERVIAASLNDLYSTKLDISAFTSYSGAVDTTIGNKLNTADFNTYSGAVDTAIGIKAAQSDLEELSGTVSGHTVALSNKVDNDIYSAFSASVASSLADFSGQSQTVAAALVQLDNKIDIVDHKAISFNEVITALGYTPTNIVYTAVTVTADLNNQTCPVTLTANGQQCNVLYINDSTAHNVVISTTYKTPDGEPITLELAANGYGEVNYMYYGGDIYVKAS